MSREARSLIHFALDDCELKNTTWLSKQSNKRIIEK